MLRPGRTLFVCRGEVRALRDAAPDVLVTAMEATMMCVAGRDLSD